MNVCVLLSSRKGSQNRICISHVGYTRIYTYVYVRVKYKYLYMYICMYIVMTRDVTSTEDISESEREVDKIKRSCTIEMFMVV